ncbi:MAG: alpha/beta fold hydrolase [Myxococcaceae bacterium]
MKLIRLGGRGGVPLIALHGGPGETHHVLRPHLDRLATPARELVFYDQRREPVPWQQHVADLESIRAELGVPTLDLLGFSWGATLALLYAAEHRAAVRQLIMLSVPGTPRAVDPAPAHATLAAELPTLDPARRAFVLAIAPWLADPRAALRVSPVVRDDTVAKAVDASLGKVHHRALATNAKGPRALVVHGELDPVPLDHARAVADALGATFLPIASSGHAPFVEQPEATLAALESFLGSA